MVMLLLQFIGKLPGHGVTFGEAHRPRETAELYASQGRGIADSLHRDRLAIDLNLFIEGLYVPSGIDAYRPLGLFWESIGGEWGGRFDDPPDPGHFSLAHGGRR
jgi:hypothetical protein